MLNIATPISQLFDDSCSAEKIQKYSDCLECRDRSLSSLFPKQYLLHLEAEIFHEWAESRKKYIASIVNSKKELKLVTFHMGSCYPDANPVDNIYLPNGDAYSRERLLLTAKENIAWLKLICGKIEIGVENNNYYPTLAYRDVTDGDFITELVESNGIRFLLDLAHAMITSRNKGIELSEYLADLPLDYVIQLHFCKPGMREDGLTFDDHGLPDQEIFSEVEKLIKAFPVEYLTVEYYQNADRLVEVLGQCQKLKGAKVYGG